MWTHLEAETRDLLSRGTQRNRVRRETTLVRVQAGRDLCVCAGCGRIKWFKSNQIKSLLLSHHHSTSALVSEILMSVLQTVQKNNKQFTYGQTVQKNNKQFTYGQTVQKNNKQFTYGQTVQKNNKQFTYGQTVQKNCTGAFTVLQTVQKKTTTIYIWTDSAKKNNSNLHMDRQCKKQQQFTYGQYIFTDCTEDNVQNTHTYTQYA